MATQMQSDTPWVNHQAHLEVDEPSKQMLSQLHINTKQWSKMHIPEEIFLKAYKRVVKHKISNSWTPSNIIQGLDDNQCCEILCSPEYVNFWIMQNAIKHPLYMLECLEMIEGPIDTTMTLMNDIRYHRVSNYTDTLLHIVCSIPSDDADSERIKAMIDRLITDGASVEACGNHRLRPVWNALLARMFL